MPQRANAGSTIAARVRCRSVRGAQNMQIDGAGQRHALIAMGGSKRWVVRQSGTSTQARPGPRCVVRQPQSAAPTQPNQA